MSNGPQEPGITDLGITESGITESGIIFEIGIEYVIPDTVLPGSLYPVKCLNEPKGFKITYHQNTVGLKNYSNFWTPCI